jgi:phenylpropionate dioxygenase-like ring-hydroxylating dioxygenase large terminal subunit
MGDLRISERAAAADSIASRVGSGPDQYPTPPSLLPARNYRDEAQYERELSSVFPSCWLPIAPVADVAEPRSYVMWQRFGQSVVVARLDDGRLSAWHNVCQHRGARLVDASGRCPTGSFKCPWHGFAYDLEGRVVHVPLREAFDEAELRDLRAPGVQVRESSGFVWIALDPAAPPLEQYLGELGAELAGYALDGWDAPYRDEWRIEANYKTVIDAFNETWHVPFTHKNTVKGGLLWRDAALRIMDPHSMMAIPVRKEYGDVEAVRENDHRRTMLCHYLSFPNTIFNCFPDHVQVFSAWPAGPRSTVLTAWGLIAPPAEGVDSERYRRRADRDWEHFRAVVEEDVGVLEAAGEIYDSLGFRRNMFNAAEGRLTAYHAAMNARVEDGSLPGAP